MNSQSTVETRLIILEGDLNRVLVGLEKLDGDLKDFGTGGQNQRGVRMLLVNKVKILTKASGRLRTDLAKLSVVDLWNHYGDLRDQSDQLYREFVEIIGGVAIRRQEIDQRNCLIAQELVRGALDPPSLIILSAENRYIPNLGRLMRIRFSDQLIWTLPLTAHQFAYVLIEDYEDFKLFAQEQAGKEVNADADVFDIAGLDPESARKKAFIKRKLGEAAGSRWEQLMADCIALYIVGPCYAGSALLFRFSPVAGIPEAETQAPDIERAHVCLEMLRNLDKNANTNAPYKEFITWLEEMWTQMLADAGMSTVLTHPRKAQLNTFVDELYQLLDQNLPAAEYPAYQDQYSGDLGGWSVAREWAERWQQEKRNGLGMMQVPTTLSPSSKVRDALNAAWLCRSRFKPSDMRELEDMARQVCEKIIADLYKPSAERAMAAAAQGPAPSRGR